MRKIYTEHSISYLKLHDSINFLCEISLKERGASMASNALLLNNLEPLKREPISVTILNIIVDNILSGNLKPGDKLPTEIELAEQLGIGRNSVREAIKMLSALGVIEIKRGQGTFIVETMPSSALNQLLLSLAFHQGTSKELIELRLLLEMGAAILAIDNASDEDIARLEEANNRLREAQESMLSDRKLLRDLDLNVHFTLLEITKNAYIEKIGKAIYRLFYASIENTVKEDENKAYRNHQLYIDAIKKRDKKLAINAINQAFSFWIDYVKKYKMEDNKDENSQSR